MYLWESLSCELGPVTGEQQLMKEKSKSHRRKTSYLQPLLACASQALLLLPLEGCACEPCMPGIAAFLAAFAPFVSLGHALLTHNM